MITYISYLISEGGFVFNCPLKIRSLGDCMNCKFFSAFSNHHPTKFDVGYVRCLYNYNIVDDIFLDDLLDLLHKRFD